MHFLAKIFCIALLLPFSLLAQERFVPQQKTTNPFVLDGVLSPEEWDEATPIPLDIEFEPANNQPARTVSFGYISYTQTHLYVGFRAEVSPDKIRAAVRPRDDEKMWNDDVVLIRLDSYADGRNNYIFACNPLGSQYDVRGINAMEEEKMYDATFNANFRSAGRITDTGYEVEMEIPFSEIPFPNGTDQTWHFNFYRKYYENGNEIEVSTQARDRDNSCVVCQTTDVLELKDIRIEKRLELLPYLSSSVQGNRSAPKDNIAYEALTGAVGLGLNLDLNKNTALEITLNPDFSQVEADVTQIDVNSAFSLQYPERRPFFNRGTDLVRFSSEAFYSRSINAPIMATKLLSQGRRSRIYQLTTIDQQSPYLIAGEDQSFLAEGGTSYVNVLRYQRVLDKNSRMGFMTTNRFFEGGGSGNLFGIDGLFLLGKNWRLTFELFKSFNVEPVQDWLDTDKTRFGHSIRLDGEKYHGDALFAQVFRNTEHWKSYLFYRQLSPHYQADVGFVVKNNRKHTTLYHEYQNIINTPLVQSFGFGFKGDYVYTFQQRREALSTDLFFQMKMLGNTALAVVYDYDWFKEFNGNEFKNLGTTEIELFGAPSEKINYRINMMIGKDVSFNEVVPRIGNLRTYYFGTTIQFNDSFRINPSVRYSRLENRETGSNYFEGQIARVSFRYQFSNFLNLRIISEHNTFNERFYIQPLLQWNPNPATIVYFGGNQNTSAFSEWSADVYHFNRSQFFFKFQYLIGLR